MLVAVLPALTPYFYIFQCSNASQDASRFSSIVPGPDVLGGAGSRVAIALLSAGNLVSPSLCPSPALLSSTPPVQRSPVALWRPPPEMT